MDFNVHRVFGPPGWRIPGGSTHSRPDAPEAFMSDIKNGPKWRRRVKLPTDGRMIPAYKITQFDGQCRPVGTAAETRHGQI